MAEKVLESNQGPKKGAIKSGNTTDTTNSTISMNEEGNLLCKTHPEDNNILELKLYIMNTDEAMDDKVRTGTGKILPEYNIGTKKGSRKSENSTDDKN